MDQKFGARRGGLTAFIGNAKIVILESNFRRKLNVLNGQDVRTDIFICPLNVKHIGPIL
jgi:hypothetical protein